jgi:Cu(I)/Ag(I) efflux system membrane fusion protein/cobalt-zinc-cadmium efflux system membrane fusion protein
MKPIRIFSALCSFYLLFSTVLIAQEHKHSDHSKMEMKADTTKTENIVREGKIDLKAIDKNKDGKVYQDPMDWNVISDKPGKCPLCKMTLKEVALKQAKENLKKNGFKVK